MSKQSPVRPTQRPAMSSLHREFEVGPEDTLEVTIDHPANVMMMTPEDFANYRDGRPYRYHGGHATTTPVRFVPASRERWHIVVDLGGGAGSVRAAVRVVSGEGAGS